MRKIILLLAKIGGVISGLMTSCYDDKGNYNYITLDEVVIDTAGLNILPAYSLNRYDRLIMEPNILFNGERVNDNENLPLWPVHTLYSLRFQTVTRVYRNTSRYNVRWKNQLLPDGW